MKLNSKKKSWKVKKQYDGPTGYGIIRPQSFGEELFIDGISRKDAMLIVRAVNQYHVLRSEVAQLNQKIEDLENELLEIGERE